jgi:glycosyltransferase involved in cell wall biosynthesis
LRDVAVSVVIPALNEAESLPYVLARIPSDVHEVILVDGLSTDGTPQVARQVMPSIRIVNQLTRGKGAALRAGFEAATGDIIVHLDADGSTDPAEIPLFVGCLLAGADFVKGSRFMQGAGSTDITRLRRLGNLFFVKLSNVLFGSGFSDISYGYNALWSRNRHFLALEIDGWEQEQINSIRAVRRGLRVAEVPSFESARIAGIAKLSTWSTGWAVLKAIVAERLRPLPRAVPDGLEQPALPYADWWTDATGSPVVSLAVARSRLRVAVPIVPEQQSPSALVEAEVAGQATEVAVAAGQ